MRKCPDTTILNSIDHGVGHGVGQGVGNGVLWMFNVEGVSHGISQRFCVWVWSRDGHADAPHARTANMRLHMHVKFWRMTIPSLAIGLVMGPVIRLLTWSVRGVTQVSKVTLVAVNHSYYGQSWGQSTSDQMSSRSQVSKLTLCVKNGTITDHSPPPKPLQELGFKGQLKILALLPLCLFVESFKWPNGHQLNS